jgi:hypothetical protein
VASASGLPIDMRQLISRAAELFLLQPPHEQRHLVMEKAAWKDRALRATLFESFEILRHSNLESLRKENERPGPGQHSEVWLRKHAEFEESLRRGWRAAR